MTTGRTVAPDPKWLEILKASGWQTTFLAVGCAVFLVLVKLDIIVVEPWPWIVPAVALALIVCTALALASIAQASIETVPVHKWVERWLAKRKARRRIAGYIPFMNDQERQIIGYLLKHRQKSFTCASDGGRAATLISRGIIVVAARQGQMVDMEDVPMVVPDHAWEVLEQHRDQFPHRPEMNGDVEMYPWREHWGVRI
jgi:hypothetical protein